MASRPSKFDHPHPRRPHGTIRCPVDVQGSLAQCAPQIGCRRHVANVLIFMLSQRFQSYNLLAERVCFATKDLLLARKSGSLPSSGQTLAH